MKHLLNHLAVVALVFGTTLVFSPPAAEAKGRAKHNASPKKPVHVIHDKVSKIDATSISVKGKSGEKTYSIGQFTEILLRGKTVSVSEIKVGMDVMVGADSSGKATLINAQ